MLGTSNTTKIWYPHPRKQKGRTHLGGAFRLLRRTTREHTHTHQSNPFFSRVSFHVHEWQTCNSRYWAPCFPVRFLGGAAPKSTNSQDLQERAAAEGNFEVVKVKPMGLRAAVSKEKKPEPLPAPPTSSTSSTSLSKKPAGLKKNGKNQSLNALILLMMEREKKIKHTIAAVLGGQTTNQLWDPPSRSQTTWSWKKIVLANNFCCYCKSFQNSTPIVRLSHSCLCLN